MNMSDEIRKTLSDPKPLYALAGAGDLAAEKLRDAPTLLTEAADTVTTLATRLAAEAPERLAKVQARLAEVPGGLDPRSVVATLDPRTARESIRDAVGKADPQALRERAQSIALSQVGRVLEAAGKAVETYDGLAERGKTVLDRYLGAGDSGPSDVTVVVEQVIVDEHEAEATSKTTAAAGPSDEAEPEIEDAVVEEPAGVLREDADTEAEIPEPRAKKTTSTPRKRAAASKTTTSSKNTASKSAPSGGTASKGAKA